jgi:hypothetical protein
MRSFVLGNASIAVRNVAPAARRHKVERPRLALPVAVPLDLVVR